MKIVDGNNACSSIAYLFSEVCAIYPITPSSPMAENIDALSHTKENNFLNFKPKVIEMESELGAAGALHGALMSGSLASTFTASQGLLLMLPNMYKIAGEMWPGVIHCASRSLATHALSIFGDHQDIYAARATGWCMLSSTNVEDAKNLAAVAHLSAIKASLPFLHFFDGFRTSHELNTIEELDTKKIIKLIDKKALKKFKDKALNLHNEINYGTSQTEDIYFECMEAKNKYYDDAVEIVNNYMEEINKITGKDYKPFNYYGSKNAKYVIVAMGSICDTIKNVIDSENNSDLGLVEVHLYRPFSQKYFTNILPKTTEKIAVLDRTKEHGSVGEPLFLDVVSILKDTNIKVVGGRYGLSSKNTSPSEVMSVFDMLCKKEVNNFTIGIKDDLTNLSLPVKPYNLDLKCQEFKIYGFGSDGMVSASKEILKLTNKSLNKYVQGYFEYDSRKSGGLTICHLRIGDKKINAPYYIINPSIVVVTKDEYFHKYKILENIKENGYLLINTIKNEEELNNFLSENDKEIINKRHITVNIINAEKIAFENNIKGKISKIMEVILLKLLNVDNALELVSDAVKEVFKTKGKEIIDSNINSMKMAFNELKKVNIDNKENGIKEIYKNENIFDIMNHKECNIIKTSDVLNICNGQIPWGLSKKEKRKVATLTPKWNSEKCIECGMCSLVCPHAVIRNFAIKDKTKGKEFIGNKDYNFYVGISNEDCTSCGLCSSICPTKSITMEENVKSTNELFDSYQNPEIFNKYTIKGSQLKNPKFEFNGACAGCGETPYIKLLTQLFGNEIVIANATGCSSIYGGSSPSMPYSLPWANSLFEDNAEFAYGIHMSYKQKKEQIISVMKNTINVVDKNTQKLFNEFLNNSEDYEITNKVYNNLDDEEIPQELINLKPYMSKRVVWAIGGDGWAYDIGYNGIDHILHSNENIKILVLDTEVYSNTGGQASKSTNKGAIAAFADLGKRTNKKDLFKIASTIENCYVASVSLGANMMHTIKAFKEAEEHDGPAIIIAYCPCIEHGIKKGMVCSSNEEKLAVECGYVLLMRYFDNTLYLDSNEPNFDKYEEFLENEVRFNALKIKDNKLAEVLLTEQKNNAIKRYESYKKLV